MTEKQNSSQFDFEYDYEKTDEENTRTLNLLVQDLSGPDASADLNVSKNESKDPLEQLKRLNPEELESLADTMPDLSILMPQKTEPPVPQEVQAEYQKPHREKENTVMSEETKAPETEEKEQGDDLDVLHVEDLDEEEEAGVAKAAVGLLVSVIAAGAALVGWGLLMGHHHKKNG